MDTTMSTSSTMSTTNFTVWSFAPTAPCPSGMVGCCNRH